MARIPDLTIPQVSPTGWGARVDYDRWTRPTVDPDKVVVHWPGSDATALLWVDTEHEAQALRGMEAFHLDTKRWSGIGYGFSIGLTGTVYRLRGYNASYAAHLGDIDNDGIKENDEAIPILLAFHKDRQPTVDQLESLLALREDLERDFMKPLPMFGHREIFDQTRTGTPTSCPGPALPFVQGHRSSSFGTTDPEDPDMADLEKRVEALESALAAEIQRSANNRALAQLNRDKGNRAADHLEAIATVLAPILSTEVRAELAAVVEAFRDNPSDPDDD